jgi:hypothetical protein
MCGVDCGQPFGPIISYRIQDVSKPCQQTPVMANQVFSDQCISASARRLCQATTMLAPQTIIIRYFSCLPSLSICRRVVPFKAKQLVGFQILLRKLAFTRLKDWHLHCDSCISLVFIPHDCTIPEETSNPPPLPRLIPPQKCSKLLFREVKYDTLFPKD